MDTTWRKPRRKDDRIIIHFDYDCFYASCIEATNPALKSLPLAIQQKQIIVTCNYVARSHGLRKLQLLSEAKKVCPSVVVVSGEDLTPFRDASKLNSHFLAGFSWNKKVERLGLDEVFLDVTDIIDYNYSVLNPHDLPNSFFILSKDDPTRGFPFDATSVSGHEYPNPNPPPPQPPTAKQLAAEKRAIRDFGYHHRDPETPTPSQEAVLARQALQDSPLQTRLTLASHLAGHMRCGLEAERGHTCSVGISTSKLLAKLVGNLHKPAGQTTLLPPYEFTEVSIKGNVGKFMDGLEIGKVPGIGSKMAQIIRDHVIALYHRRDAPDPITVEKVRYAPGMCPRELQELLGGPGAAKDIGHRTWLLLHGIDDSEVKTYNKIPQTISIEDSYGRLDEMRLVERELHKLATSLLKRMHADLLEPSESAPPSLPQSTTATPQATPQSATPVPQQNTNASKDHWVAHPKTLRLTTCPRPPPDKEGKTSRGVKRISRSAPLPRYVFNLDDRQEAIAAKLVSETLVPMFRRLHPEPKWNLSVVNVAVTNIVSLGSGASISTLFGKPKLGGVGVSAGSDVIDNGDAEVKKRGLKRSQIRSDDDNLPAANTPALVAMGSEDMDWEEDDDDEEQEQERISMDEEINPRCEVCGKSLPAFAMGAHRRFHEMGG